MCVRRSVYMYMWPDVGGHMCAHMHVHVSCVSVCTWNCLYFP